MGLHKGLGVQDSIGAWAFVKMDFIRSWDFIRGAMYVYPGRTKQNKQHPMGRCSFVSSALTPPPRTVLGLHREGLHKGLGLHPHVSTKNIRICSLPLDNLLLIKTWPPTLASPPALPQTNSARRFANTRIANFTYQDAYPPVSHTQGTHSTPHPPPSDVFTSARHVLSTSPTV